MQTDTKNEKNLSSLKIEKDDTSAKTFKFDDINTAYKIAEDAKDEQREGAVTPAMKTHHDKKINNTE